MDLKELHLLARSMTFSEFETEVRYRIDKVLPTVNSDDEYVVVNKNAVLRNVSNNEVAVCRCKIVSEVKISRDGKPWCRTCGNLLRQTDC